MLLTAGPLLVYRSREGSRFPYSPAAVNLLTELLKCALSVCFLVVKKVGLSTLYTKSLAVVEEEEEED